VLARRVGFMMPRGVCLLCVGMVLMTSAGCAFFRTVTFQSDDMSFQREGSKAKLELYGSDAPEACKDGPQRAKAIPLLLAPLAGQFLLHLAESEIQGFLEKKKKEFTANYTAMVSAPYYYQKALTDQDLREGLTAYSKGTFNCLRLQRTIRADGQEVVAFRWVGALVWNTSTTSLKVETEALEISRAAARTDKGSRKIDVTIEVKIDSTTHNERGDGITTTLADKTLAFPGAIIGETYPLGTDDTKVGTSSWFPEIPKGQQEIDRCGLLTACLGVTALNVSVMVAEVGSGGDSFGELGKQIDDNKKTMEDAVSKAIDALTSKSSGGSSPGSTGAKK
jgi:hypothetical protein